MPTYDYFRVTKYVTYYEIARRWYLALEKNGHDCWIEEKQTGGEWAVWRRGEGAGFSDNQERCQGRIIKASDKDIKTTLKGWE
jgi:hypothetical protein